MTLDREIRIAIPGRAVPKGSMKCIGRRGRVAHQLVEQVDNAGWRTVVVDALARYWPAGDGRRPVKHQPVGVKLTFTLERPKTHHGTGRNARTLKAAAPDYPAAHGTGDVDKLARLILDALQDGDVLPNDAQVVQLTARKFYAGDPHPDALGYPGAVIRLYPI
jgi:hypothetical protein